MSAATSEKHFSRFVDEVAFFLFVWGGCRRCRIQISEPPGAHRDVTGTVRRVATTIGSRDEGTKAVRERNAESASCGLSDKVNVPNLRGRLQRENSETPLFPLLLSITYAY